MRAHLLSAHVSHSHAPEQYDWEKVGNWVNEGPQAVIRNDRLFVIYSASLTLTTDYSLGLLEMVGWNATDPTHWYKHPAPSFTANSTERIWGPGHHSITRSSDPLAMDDWLLFFHAKTTTNITMDDRYIHVQKMGWTVDGRPDLGGPKPMTRPCTKGRRGRDTSWDRALPGGGGGGVWKHEADRG